jgi:alpha-beta hydrolase superfamily lysophospholipase
MFNAVQGWKNEIPASASHFVETGRDGSRLEGAIQLSENTEVKGVVMLCHPFLKYGMHYFFNNKLAQALSNQGFHVVTFNFKGFGRSNIKGHAFNEDVFSIADMVKLKFPDMALHLIGCSFGGFHLSHALAVDSLPFTSVVLDSVPPSVTVFFKGGFLAKAMRWISSSKLAEATGTRPIKHSLTQVSGLPIAYLYGDEDKYVPLSDVADLKSSCGDIEFIPFRGCGHLDIYKHHKQQYIQTVVQFFSSHTVTEVK